MEEKVKHTSIYDPLTEWTCDRCGHIGLATRTSSGCVLNWYCKKCGNWLFDKDVS